MIVLQFDGFLSSVATDIWTDDNYQEIHYCRRNLTKKLHQYLSDHVCISYITVSDDWKVCWISKQGQSTKKLILEMFLSLVRKTGSHWLCMQAHYSLFPFPPWKSWIMSWDFYIWVWEVSCPICLLINVIQWCKSWKVCCVKIVMFTCRISTDSLSSATC